MTERTGQIIGNYRLTALISADNTVEHYRARHIHLDRDVAVALLAESDDAIAAASFLAAGRAAAALVHPQILPVLDLGEHDGAAYVAYEHSNAGSLRSWLATPQDHAPRLWIDLFRQAAEGLAGAHARGVIHGALTPDDLLLQKEPADNITLKIGGFGRATVSSEQAKASSGEAGPASADEAIATDLQALRAIFRQALAPLLEQERDATLGPLLERCLNSSGDRSASALAAALTEALAEYDRSRPPEATSPQGHIGLTLTTTDLLLTPGETTDLTITIANRGLAAETVAVSMTGVPAAWIEHLPEQIPLEAGERRTLTVSLTVAKRPEHAADELPVAIAAHPIATPDEVATLTMRWQIASFVEAALELTPDRRASTGVATFALALRNGGNAAARHELAASDASGALGFRFEREMVDVAPGTTAPVRMQVSARSRWVGLPHTYPFTVTASATDGPLTTPGEFVQQPLIPVWAWPLVATILILLIVVTTMPLWLAPATGQAPETPSPVAAGPTPTTIVEASAAPIVPAATPGNVAARIDALTISAPSLAFGERAVGSSTAQSLQVVNNGAVALSFQRLQLSGAAARDFAREGTCGAAVLQPGQACRVTITFTPSAEGVRTATLTLALANGDARTIPLSGAGIVPATRPVPGTNVVTSAAVPPPLTGARSGQSAALFDGGRQVLVAGGRRGDNILKSTEIYDLVTNRWSGAWDLTVPRADHASVTLPDGRVLVIGGTNGIATLTSIEAYDPAQRGWRTFAPLTAPRAGLSATLITDPEGRDYRILVLGGRDERGVLADGEIYDSRSDRWSVMPLPQPRAGHVVALLADGRRVLVVGGVGADDRPAPSVIYDTGSGLWTEVAAPPASSLGASATTLPDGRVLVAGGQEEGKAVATTVIFDPLATNGGWQSGPPLSKPRAMHAAVLLPGGRLLLIGGREAGHDETTVELLDISVSPSRGTPAPER